jgi:hypothetical protein
MKRLYKIIIIIIILINSGISQSLSGIIRTGLDGIIKGPYQKPGWREYVMPDRMEIPLDFLSPRINSHPLFWFPAEIKNASLSTDPQVINWLRTLRQAVTGFNSSQKSALVFKRASIAKSAAFLYYMEGNPSYLQQAISILTHLPDPPEIRDLEGGVPGTGWGDFLESAQAMGDLMVCYDLIWNNLTSQERARFEKIILKVINQLIDAQYYTTRNNHTVVFATAIGMVALTIDEPEKILPYNRNQLYQLSIDLLSESLGNISPDGGYSEGIGYAVYILNYLTQFALYQNKITGHHLFQNSIMEQFLHWTLDNIRPTSNLSQFDDSFKRIPPYFIALIPSLLPENSELHSYRKILNAYSSYHTLMSEGLLTVRRARLYHPERRTFLAMKWYPIYGEAVFKDRDGSPRNHGIFLFENPAYFADVHEHVEPLAIEISHQKGDIISGAGYSRNTSDPDRYFYTSAYGYSGVFINGQGFDFNHLSADNPAPLYTFHYASPSSGAAVARMNYQNARVTRSVFFDTSGIFVIYDQSVGEKNHTMTSHFNTPIQPIYTESHGFLLQNRSVRHLILPLRDEETSGLAGILNNNYYYFEYTTKPSSVASQATVIIPDYLPSVFQYIRKRLNSKQIVLEMYRTDINRFFRIGLNKGETMNYSPSSLETDAAFWIHSFSGSSTLEQLWLLQVQTIQWHSLELAFSTPVELIISKSMNGLECLFSSMEDSCQVTVKSPVHRAVFLNSSRIQTDKPIFIRKGENRLSIGLISTNLYTYSLEKTTPTHPLFGLPQLESSFPPYSDWQRTRMQESILDQTYDASTHALRFQSNRLFNDSLFLEQSVNSILGLIKYNYILYDDTYRFKIPHRYQFRGNHKNNKWDVQEAGEFTNRGIRIRQTSIQWQSGKQSRYQFFYTHLTANQYEYRFQNSNSMFTQIIQLTQYPSQKKLSQSIYIRSIGAGYQYTWNKGRMEFQHLYFHRNRINFQLFLFQSPLLRGWQGEWHWQPFTRQSLTVFYQNFHYQFQTWKLDLFSHNRFFEMNFTFRRDRNFTNPRVITSLFGNFYRNTRYSSHRLYLATRNNEWSVAHFSTFNNNRYYFEFNSQLDSRMQFYDFSGSWSRIFRSGSSFRTTLDFRQIYSNHTLSANINYIKKIGEFRLGPAVELAYANTSQLSLYPGIFLHMAQNRNFFSFQYLESPFLQNSRIRQLQMNSTVDLVGSPLHSYAIFEWINDRLTFARGILRLDKERSPGIEFFYRYPETVWIQGSLVWVF